MLKRSYKTEAEIPTEFRAEYVQKDGLYVLDVEGFDNVESVLSKNQELVRTNTGLKSTITQLQTSKTELEAKSLPEGHVAIPVAEKTYLDKVKPLGTPEEIATKVTEHATLATEKAKTEAEKHFGDVASAMGWNEAATKLLLPTVTGLPKLEVRTTKDAKGADVKSVVALVPSAPGSTTLVEKPLSEIVETIAPLKEALPVLSAKTQEQRRTIPNQQPINDQGGGSADIVDQRLAARNKARQENPNPLMPAASTTTAGAAATS